ncbi:MAG: DUF6089 family protein [Saprospiraceae bacterium]
MNSHVISKGYKGIKNYTACIIFFIFFILLTPAKGQFFEVGFNLAGTTYQGDISPLRYRFSVQGASFAYGLNLGYHISPYYSVKVSYNKGSIDAADKYSVDAWRKERNLNFRTDIHEWSLVTDIFFLEYSKFFRKYNLKPFLRVGVAVFSFNPQGEYKGKWYDLQPLATEGQGLKGSDKEPYKLTQLSIPFGFGLCYDINQYIRVGLDISPRITFTDYLDDVSTDYPDFDQLGRSRGQMAVNLSYKGNLLPGGYAPEDIPTVGRGNPKDNDWYIFTSFSLAILFDPVYENIKRKTFNGARKCRF